MTNLFMTFEHHFFDQQVDLEFDLYLVVVVVVDTVVEVVEDDIVVVAHVGMHIQ